MTNDERNLLLLTARLLLTTTPLDADDRVFFCDAVKRVDINYLNRGVPGAPPSKPQPQRGHFAEIMEIILMGTGAATLLSAFLFIVVMWIRYQIG